MPPPSVPTGPSRISGFPISNGYAQLPEIFLFVLVVASCIRCGVLYCTRRKRRVRKQCQQAQEKNRTSYPIPPEKDSRRFQISSESFTTPPSFKPIYPWKTPPQPLPGPYDPRLYPLPTIRRHSDPDPSPESLDQTTISYSRRVSTNSMPARQYTLQGTITTANNGTSGWRRNQWVVSGG
ncbi:uncharacterized protein BDR25DRAFT_79177 [Lindgomyces ingoldianus]|uniref:Uncharacterized protein n=1 Tax=Lindgomyces ingoldianus TaxID=673940 RepID=A0ACB6QIV7_9PLEO|nr:uncharacterized protein BDR25DRAFT_79177 [Lindgomyces ingoldianus]KAF2466070.1 hypothetical protein BDR25DRAFT_79177 [Lindgomyces ingoldianus]